MSIFSSHANPKHRIRHLRSLQSLITGSLFLGTSIAQMPTAWAASPSPGSVIENQATGSFVNPTTSDRVNIESNVVQVTVAEVAGVTLTPAGVQEAPATIGNPGPNQGNNSINAEDVVYFLFKATNVGNDPTQFFIPGSPSSITGGIQAGQIEIIEVDADGPNGPNAPTDFSSLPITIRPEGNNTGDATVLGLPVGGLPATGTITLRVPVKLDAGLNTGDTATVVLGDTGSNDNTPGTQNQPYLVSTEPNPPAGGFDFYTQDNADTDGIANEADGEPINGDSTFHRQEASATQVATMTALGLNLDYGDAPDTAINTGPGDYQTTAADSGPSHVIDPNLYIGTPPDGDDGTQQNVAANQDDTFITADEGAIAIPTIDETATSYTLSDIEVTNNTRLNATLIGWIDFNQNGLFEVNESTTIAVPNTGTQTVDLTWSSLPGLIPGQTYARFRLTTDAAILPSGEPISTGAANDGEVEDYSVTVSSAVSISGTLYEDTDGQDDYDIGTETPLPSNITVRLLSSDGTIEIDSVQTVNGFYSFNNVAPGAYQIAVETTDPDIGIGLDIGTTNPIPLSVSSVSFSGLDFGFDRTTTGGAITFCRNPYGEVYSGSSNFDIYAIHPPTGATVLLTNTAGTQNTNSLATDHFERLVYYAENQAIYAWDPITNVHIRLEDSTGEDNVTLMPGGNTIQSPFGGGGSLSLGGGAFYNGSYYFGIEQAGDKNTLTEVYRVDFVPGSNGRTIQSLTPLGINDSTGGANGALDTAVWGDMIFDDNGILYGSTRTAGFFWRFDPSTGIYTNISSTYAGQLAKDGDGVLWGLDDSANIQRVDPTTGALIPPAQPTSVSIADLAECVQGRSSIGDRIWNDLNSDGIQDPGEPGIANVTVGIYRDINNDGLIDAGDPLLATQVTSIGGNYDFTDLISGNYIIQVLEGTANDQDTTNVLGTATQTNPPAPVAGTHSHTIPLGVNDYNDADFGYNLGVVEPEVILIKRITAINGVPINPNDSTDLSAYVDGAGLADNHVNWPEGADPDSDPDLYGAITGGVVQPDDEIEYTIYFLSAGEEPAANVVFCDRIPDGQTFILDSFNNGTPAPNGTPEENRGIEISTNNSTLAYTNIGGDDTGRFYPPTSGLPPACNTLIPNTENNGAVVIDLGTLPNSTGAGVPATSTGYVRFRTRTK